MEELEEISDEDLLFELSENCARQPSSYSYSDDSEELEEPEEEPNDEVEDNPEEELEEDPEEGTEEPMENPSEASFLKLSSQKNNDEDEHKSVPDYLSDKKRSIGATVGEATPLQVYQSGKKYKHAESSKPESECGFCKSDLSNALNDSCASEHLVHTGSSGKSRCSRWDQRRDWETAEDDRTNETWLAVGDSLSKMIGASLSPEFMKEFVNVPNFNPETLELKAKLLQIVSKLLKPELHDDRPEHERSPSPEPVYNHLGIRINTREVRLRRKLNEERNNIISKLVRKDPTFKPPHDYKPKPLYKKIYIPVKEYPEYNFTGLILGPRGNTQKRMEMETGAKIYLRGKGSSVIPKGLPFDNEELHVYIEADNQQSLDAAAGMVEKILVPMDEGVNELKRAQLEELAKLNRTSKEPNLCKVFSEQGHQHYALPCLPCASKTPFFDTCGSNSKAIYPSTTPSPHSNSLQFTAGVGIHATPLTQQELNKEINDANLYVCHLPIALDEVLLTELFSPFGKIAGARVIRDQTTGFSKGFGFVFFECASDAAAALTHMNGYILDGHVLQVKVGSRPAVKGYSASSPSSNSPQAFSGNGATPVTQSNPNKETNEATIYVCYLPRTVDENCLIELFSPFGEIVGARVMKDRFTGTSRGFGFVHFKSASDAAVAIAHMNGYQLDGHVLAVRVAGCPLVTGSSASSSRSDTLQGSSGHGLGDNLISQNKHDSGINGATLIVGYLPQAADENCLKELFSPFGKIIDTEVIRDQTTGISQGNGYIYFEKASDAAVAVTQMTGYMLKGHMIVVRTAECPPVTKSSMLSAPSNSLQASSGHMLGATPTTQSECSKESDNAGLLVGSLPTTWDENYLTVLFSPFGKIIEAKVLREQTAGISKGCGFVKFENASDAAMALSQMNSYVINGHTLEVKVAEHPPVTKSSVLSPDCNLLEGSSILSPGATSITQSKPNKEISDANLFVGCLPLTVDENYLKMLFSPFGKIIDVKVLRDFTTGISKCCGFVNFENASDAGLAVTQVNGYVIEGRPVVVNVAGHRPVAVSSAQSPYSNLLQGSSKLRLVATPITHSKPKREINEANLYVCYLPQALDESCLLELFSPFGNIISVKLMRDKITGISKGSGFVLFEKASNAAVAVAHMNGFILEGHMLAVRVAGLPAHVRPVLSFPPQYHGTAAIAQDAMSQTTWAGQPGSLLPGPEASIVDSGGMSFLSPSINSGHGNQFPASQAFGFTPLSNESSQSDLNSASSLHSSYNVANQIPSQSNSNTASSW